MEMCANCASELDPSWKFCVKCGTPVPAGTAGQSGGETNDVEASTPAAAVAAPAAPAAKSRQASSAAGAKSIAATTGSATPAAKPASTRTPRRAKSSFTTPTNAAPIVTPPAEKTPDAAAPAENEPIAAPSLVADEAPVERLLTPESALSEPALPRVVRHGTEPSDPSRLGTARSEYARFEREAAEGSVPEEYVAEASAAPVDAPAATPFIDDENPFSHDLPPRPEPPKTRAEAKAAAAVREATRARTMAEAKADIRARYPIPSASADNRSLEYTEDSPAAFRTVDGVPTRRKVDVPLIVSISLSTAGVILIVYLAILVFGARG